MKNSDIEKIRDVAITFAYLPFEPSEKIPLFVSHPFLNTAVTVIQTKDGQEFVNVMEEDGGDKVRNSVIKQLKKVKKPVEFFVLLTNPYRFTFLDNVQEFLNNDDLGECLRFIWINSEYTNCGSVFTKRKLVSLFRRGTKETLMDEEELEIFRDLPDHITVYRGTTSVNSKDPKVFSWSLSEERAKWFSRRFNDDVQQVFRAELPKEGALAYFSTEEEIIANPFKLKNIEQTE